MPTNNNSNRDRSSTAHFILMIADLISNGLVVFSKLQLEAHSATETLLQTTMANAETHIHCNRNSLGGSPVHIPDDTHPTQDLPIGDDFIPDAKS